MILFSIKGFIASREVTAIQNMNVMYQYDEKDGLNYTPLTPV